MAKPILEPGRPGDLLMVLEHAAEQVRKLKRESKKRGEYAPVELEAIAKSTAKALSMWLGLEPVVSAPEYTRH